MEEWRQRSERERRGGATVFGWQAPCLRGVRDARASAAVGRCVVLPLDVLPLGIARVAVAERALCPEGAFQARLVSSGGLRRRAPRRAVLKAARGARGGSGEAAEQNQRLRTA